jgi:hypothetical protein
MCESYRLETALVYIRRVRIHRLFVFGWFCELSRKDLEALKVVYRT